MNKSTPDPRPLAGTVIVDLTSMLAGPFATMLLADLGADVIKIEPPHGDFIRDQGPYTDDDELHAYGGYFQSVNRNKRSVVLDLKTEEGRASLLTIVRGADGLIENFRNGVMDNLGLSYEQLREVNPRLVYGAIRGFGDSRTGASPMQEWPAYDVTVQALSGFMEITGEPCGPPTKAGPGIGDTVPALFAVIGFLAALHQARREGAGSFVDVAMYDAMLAMTERTVYQYSYTGEIPSRVGNAHPLLCPFDVAPTSDGWVSIAAPSAVHWNRLCDTIGRPDLKDDERTKDNAHRLRNRERVRAAIEAWTKVRTKLEIMELLGGKVPVAPVNNIEDIFHDPHVRARNMLVEVHHPGSAQPVTIANSPIRFAGQPGTAPRRAPLLGEHTYEVLAEFAAKWEPTDDAFTATVQPGPATTGLITTKTA